jgi:hypothetical protein
MGVIDGYIKDLYRHGFNCTRIDRLCELIPGVPAHVLYQINHVLLYIVVPNAESAEQVRSEVNRFCMLKESKEILRRVKLFESRYDTLWCAVETCNLANLSKLLDNGWSSLPWSIHRQKRYSLAHEFIENNFLAGTLLLHNTLKPPYTDGLNNLRDTDGNLAIHTAACKLQIPHLESLGTMKGVDLSLTNFQGRTWAHLLLMRLRSYHMSPKEFQASHSDCVHTVHRVMFSLVAIFPDVCFIKDMDGFTPIDFAIYLGDTTTLNVLIDGHSSCLNYSYYLSQSILEKRPQLVHYFTTKVERYCQNWSKEKRSCFIVKAIASFSSSSLQILLGFEYFRIAIDVPDIRSGKFPLQAAIETEGEWAEKSASLLFLAGANVFLKIHSSVRFGCKDDSLRLSLDNYFALAAYYGRDKLLTFILKPYSDELGTCTVGFNDTFYFKSVEFSSNPLLAAMIGGHFHSLVNLLSRFFFDLYEFSTRIENLGLVTPVMLAISSRDIQYIRTILGLFHERYGPVNLKPVMRVKTIFTSDLKDCAQAFHSLQRKVKESCPKDHRGNLGTKWAHSAEAGVYLYSRLREIREISRVGHIQPRPCRADVLCVVKALKTGKMKDPLCSSFKKVLHATLEEVWQRSIEMSSGRFISVDNILIVVEELTRRIEKDLADNVDQISKRYNSKTLEAYSKLLEIPRSAISRSPHKRILEFIATSVDTINKTEKIKGEILCGESIHMAMQHSALLKEWHILEERLCKTIYHNPKSYVANWIAGPFGLNGKTISTHFDISNRHVGEIFDLCKHGTDTSFPDSAILTSSIFGAQVVVSSSKLIWPEVPFIIPSSFNLQRHWWEDAIEIGQWRVVELALPEILRFQSDFDRMLEKMTNAGEGELVRSLLKGGINLGTKSFTFVATEAIKTVQLQVFVDLVVCSCICLPVDDQIMTNMNGEMDTNEMMLLSLQRCTASTAKFQGESKGLLRSIPDADHYCLEYPYQTSEVAKQMSLKKRSINNSNNSPDFARSLSGINCLLRIVQQVFCNERVSWNTGKNEIQQGVLDGAQYIVVDAILCSPRGQTMMLRKYFICTDKNHPHAGLIFTSFYGSISGERRLVKIDKSPLDLLRIDGSSFSLSNSMLRRNGISYFNHHLERERDRDKVIGRIGTFLTSLYDYFLCMPAPEDIRDLLCRPLLEYIFQKSNKGLIQPAPSIFEYDIPLSLTRSLVDSLNMFCPTWSYIFLSSDATPAECAAASGSIDLLSSILHGRKSAVSIGHRNPIMSCIDLSALLFRIESTSIVRAENARRGMDTLKRVLVAYDEGSNINIRTRDTSALDMVVDFIRCCRRFISSVLFFFDDFVEICRRNSNSGEVHRGEKWKINDPGTPLGPFDHSKRKSQIFGFSIKNSEANLISLVLKLLGVNDKLSLARFHDDLMVRPLGLSCSFSRTLRMSFGTDPSEFRSVMEGFKGLRAVDGVECLHSHKILEAVNTSLISWLTSIEFMVWSRDPKVEQMNGIFAALTHLQECGYYSFQDTILCPVKYKEESWLLGADFIISECILSEAQIIDATEIKTNAKQNLKFLKSHFSSWAESRNLNEALPFWLMPLVCLAPESITAFWNILKYFSLSDQTNFENLPCTIRMIIDFMCILLRSSRREFSRLDVLEVQIEFLKLLTGCQESRERMASWSLRTKLKQIAEDLDKGETTDASRFHHSKESDEIFEHVKESMKTIQMHKIANHISVLIRAYIRDSLTLCPVYSSFTKITSSSLRRENLLLAALQSRSVGVVYFVLEHILESFVESNAIRYLSEYVNNISEPATIVNGLGAYGNCTLFDFFLTGKCIVDGALKSLSPQASGPLIDLAMISTDGWTILHSVLSGHPSFTSYDTAVKLHLRTLDESLLVGDIAWNHMDYAKWKYKTILHSLGSKEFSKIRSDQIMFIHKIFACKTVSMNSLFQCSSSGSSFIIDSSAALGYWEIVIFLIPLYIDYVIYFSNGSTVDQSFPFLHEAAMNGRYDVFQCLRTLASRKLDSDKDWKYRHFIFTMLLTSTRVISSQSVGQTFVGKQSIIHDIISYGEKRTALCLLELISDIWNVLGLGSVVKFINTTGLLHLSIEHRLPEVLKTLIEAPFLVPKGGRPFLPQLQDEDQMLTTYELCSSRGSSESFIALYENGDLTHIDLTLMISRALKNKFDKMSATLVDVLLEAMKSARDANLEDSTLVLPEGDKSFSELFSAWFSEALELRLPETCVATSRHPYVHTKILANGVESVTLLLPSLMMPTPVFTVFLCQLMKENRIQPPNLDSDTLPVSHFRHLESMGLVREDSLFATDGVHKVVFL